ncbi:MAG: chemotaxis protein CheR [Acidobacteria bacterium]|nr:MAG: chemotaxis protein CheR [Acidobacteriota bacterium]
MNNREKLNKEDFKALREFIYKQSGMFFSDAKLYFIENRVSKRLEALNCPSYNLYVRHIQNPANKKELLTLLDRVTTNETSFYRNPPQIDAFKNIILPKLVTAAKAAGRSQLKIWSSACSSGEEPLTLAMVIKEKQHLLRGLNVRIYASDISSDILEKAKKGIYSEYSMRNLPELYKKKWFKMRGGSYEIERELKSMIHYERFNLVDYPGYYKYKGMDAIFCRNVLIYFDLAVKRSIIECFHKSINKNGYLIIGHAESLHNISKDFKIEHFSRAIGYLKA